MPSRNCEVYNSGIFLFSIKLTAVDFSNDYQKAVNLKLMGTWYLILTCSPMNFAGFQSGIELTTRRASSSSRG